MDWQALAIIAVAFALAGVVKGIVGFGFQLVVVAVLTISLGLLDALPLIVVPAVMTNIWQAVDGPWLREILQRLRLYLLITAVAVLLTSHLLVTLDVRWLTALLGLVLVFYALMQLLDLRWSVPARSEPPLSALLGGINGAVISTTGVFMVPAVLYMRALGFSKDKLVQAMGIFFLAAGLLLSIPLARNGLFTEQNLLVSMLAVIPAFAGIACGRLIRKRIKDDGFERLFNIALAGLGVFIFLDAVSSSG